MDLVRRMVVVKVSMEELLRVHIVARTQPETLLTQNNLPVVGILDIQGMCHNLFLWQVALCI